MLLTGYLLHLLSTYEAGPRPTEVMRNVQPENGRQRNAWLWLWKRPRKGSGSLIPKKLHW